MLLSLNAPVTGTELLVVATLVVAAIIVILWLSPRRGALAADDESPAVGSFRWLRKSALYLVVLGFLVIYPFTQPFVHWVTNLIYGVPDVAHAGNATGAEIAADQLAGGGVQLGTFFTKLWIAIIFYALFCSLPWLIQQLTHPAPTAWAKNQYTDDFNSLTPEEKFTVYGRLQYTNTAKIIGAALAAALLV